MKSFPSRRPREISIQTFLKTTVIDSSSMRYVICIILLFIVAGVTTSSLGQVNQVNIQRIELMPNEPSPYNMRDWKSVAVAYDSFVYDINKTGQYLPLVFKRSQGTN